MCPGAGPSTKITLQPVLSINSCLSNTFLKGIHRGGEDREKHSQKERRGRLRGMSTNRAPSVYQASCQRGVRVGRPWRWSRALLACSFCSPSLSGPWEHSRRAVNLTWHIYFVQKHGFLLWAQRACSVAPGLTTPQLEACSQGNRDTPGLLSQLPRTPLYPAMVSLGR